MSPQRYTRDQVIRDIVYYYYLCEQYRGLPTGGALFGVVLNGPYHTFFAGDEDDDPADPEDRLIREGSLLIFLGMLDDWDAGAGFYFKEISRGWEDNSLADYLAALLRAYQHAQEVGDDRMNSLCEEALALLARIERRGQWAREIAEIDPQLWVRLRAVTREAEVRAADAPRTHRDLYSEYVAPYFAERCS
jgi:hypothetical protein